MEDNDQKTNESPKAERSVYFIPARRVAFRGAFAHESDCPSGFAFVEIDNESTEDKAIEALDVAEWMGRELRVTKSKPLRDRALTKRGIVAEVLIEEDLGEMEKISTYIDEYNTRISEKLAVLDHMETRSRLEMDELETMVANLWA